MPSLARVHGLFRRDLSAGIFAAALCVASSSAALGVESMGLTLEIEVLNLKQGQGEVRCLLFAGPKGFPSVPDEAVRYDIVRVGAEKKAVCSFKGLKAGRYAVTLIHDANLNGQLDTRIFGIPTEGYGFSNGAQASIFGPPGFEPASAVLSQNARWRVPLVHW